MMGRLSIGWRLTVWYSAVLLAGLALFSVGVWLVVAHSLRASVDESLAAQAQGVVRVIQIEYNPARPKHFRDELNEYASATPEGNLMEIQESNGEKLVSSKVVSL